MFEEEGTNGAFPDIAFEENKVIDKLEERVSLVLKTQQEMLASLEALQMALGLPPPPTRENSPEEKEDKISTGIK
jgi:hypothetical protein